MRRPGSGNSLCRVHILTNGLIRIRQRRPGNIADPPPRSKRDLHNRFFLGGASLSAGEYPSSALGGLAHTTCPKDGRTIFPPRLRGAPASTGLGVNYYTKKDDPAPQSDWCLAQFSLASAAHRLFP